MLLIVGVLAAAALLACAVRPALASPLSETQAELEAVRGQLADLQAELDYFARAYAEAEARQAQIDDAITAAEADAKRSNEDLATARQQLNKRLVHLYKGRGNGVALLLEVFFTQTDLVKALTEFESLKKVADQDAGLLGSIQKHLTNVDVRQQDLAAKKADQAQRLTELQGAQAQLEERIAAVSSEYNGLRARVAELEEQARLQQEAAAKAASFPGLSIAEVRGFVFPVAGLHSYTDTWGDPRSGGRTHQGADIFAERGTPCVACVSGEVTQTWWNDGLGGTGIWLSGDNGISYYYAHLDSIEGGITPGTRVRAGQVIGYVGDSGNARGGPCHLHFQAHPGGGSPVNPYPALAASE